MTYQQTDMNYNSTEETYITPQWLTDDDSYVKQWFFMGSPLNFYIVIAIYLSVVLKIGPDLMKNRAPFKLSNVILAYNVMQVVLSTYMLLQGSKVILDVGLLPDKCPSESKVNKYKILESAHLYMLAKLSELLDTVFFVLRKKNSQISFLHVYHHCGIFFYSWAMMQYRLNLVVAALVLGIINSFVHVVMYSYYALSVFPSLSKYLWWKKYITSIQMVQFVVIVMFAVFEYFYSKCDFSMFLIFSFIFNLALMFFLFGRFYKKTYDDKNDTRDNDNKIKSE